MRFGRKGKLSPRYVGSYEIIQRIGQVAYGLELPPEMSSVHLVFHVSMLRKEVGDLSLIVPVETIEVNEELTYEEIPVVILDSELASRDTDFWVEQYTEELKKNIRKKKIFLRPTMRPQNHFAGHRVKQKTGQVWMTFCG
ncbi:PREDICTED: uncharacterized protein LOC109225028 [Nicotiana attenuata]|uniref:uncharacterized protein LOC109225028 n=1 Tax=Nicotiana attenuata TaxID=49451 RepID=UPI000904EE20|nr:PREDICTED: uncharacterized protein LOC109225028 [Nicotiana attenuata]